MTSEIDAALVERMEKFVREHARLATNADRGAYEARAIVALLPEPVDPDLSERDAIYKAYQLDDIDGIADAILVGIKRGRELASTKVPA